MCIRDRDNIAAYLTVALKNTLFNALKKTTDSLSFDEIGEREETVDESPSSCLLYTSHSYSGLEIRTLSEERVHGFSIEAM